MPSKTVAVGSSVGLHARPAAVISEAAGELDSEVTLGVPGGEPVDAASSLLIMTLGASFGDQVEVSGDDQAAVDAIAALVEKDLDAEPPRVSGPGDPEPTHDLGQPLGTGSDVDAHVTDEPAVADRGRPRGASSR